VHEPKPAPVAHHGQENAPASSPPPVEEPTATCAVAAATGNGAKNASAARVARIRAALLSGTYRVDLDKLAEKILKNGVLRTEASDSDL